MRDSEDEQRTVIHVGGRTLVYLSEEMHNICLVSDISVEHDKKSSPYSVYIDDVILGKWRKIEKEYAKAQGDIRNIISWIKSTLEAKARKEKVVK